MIAIGIDPGLSGYVAMVDGTSVLEQSPTPTLRAAKTRRAYDLPSMRDLLHRLRDRALEGDSGRFLVVVEKQQPMPHVQRGVSAAWKSGAGYMAWLMACTCLRLPYTVVAPRTWQKVMHRDVQGDDTKTKSILACQRLYPDCSLLATPRCTKPNDNLADAILLGHYGLAAGKD